MSEQTLLDELLSRKCQACKPGSPALGAQAVADYLKELPGWALHHNAIARTFQFKDYHHTMAFVNAVAYIAHVEDHHPDLAVSYNRCSVTYSTHAIGGLSENDFICAAKIDALLPR